MSTITAILEPHADGSLHLPLPPEMRHGKVRVEAKLEALPQPSSPGARPLSTTPLEAFKVLRTMGGLRHRHPRPGGVAAGAAGGSFLAGPRLNYAAGEQHSHLVTRNVDDFKHVVGLEIVEPFR